MAFVERSHQLKSRSFALQGVFFLFLFCFVGMLGFQFFSLHYSLFLVPLSIIYFWPRTSDGIVSFIGLFLAGLLMDVLSGGGLGQNALIYLICFGVFRPDLRLRTPALGTAWLEFAIWLMIATIILIVQDSFLDTYSINFTSLLRSIIIALVLFPLIFGLRRIGRSLFFGEDDSDM